VPESTQDPRAANDSGRVSPQIRPASSVVPGSGSVGAGEEHTFGAPTRPDATAAYDFERHQWRGQCPYGDDCSGCDPRGYCTRMEGVVLTRGQQGILNRLLDSGKKIAQMERHLAAERRRRDLLLLKATTGGLSTRRLGAIAGMSSPAVTYATRRAREALDA